MRVIETHLCENRLVIVLMNHLLLACS